MYNLVELVTEMCKQSNETPWLEFKHNNYTPDMIGKDISALANSAALYSKNCAYMIWGIDDTTHEIKGTNLNLQNIKKGNQELENWLRAMLSKNVDFEYHSISMNNVMVGVLIIYKAVGYPVSFQQVEYIRVGSYTKKLNDNPVIHAKLWDTIRNSKFEDQFSKTDLTLAEALQMLDYSVYFDLMHIIIPTDIQGIGHYMLEEKILSKQDNGLYAITNLGALLFAKNFHDFSKIERKAMRIVQYSDINKVAILKETTETKGYAVCFESVIKYIEALLPEEEVIEAFREKKSAYPTIAIREAFANALIHQDFSISGAGPVIEIFKNRIEITNPGIPMVDIYRIIDNPPRSRNERLAALMRRMGICEELGSGWDKITIACEIAKLPAPIIRIYEESTKVIIFSEIPFNKLSLEDRLWACYLHACIKQVQGEQLTNSSLRERFGVQETASGSISRLIKEALERELIKPVDANTAPRYMKYIPIWA